ncbi:hypothetical protein TRVL_01717 [Trypanosoma vivax]|nr:hypothetical protein TRVL_01717 [Trypanosoma vivax]
MLTGVRWGSAKLVRGNTNYTALYTHPRCSFPLAPLDAEGEAPCRGDGVVRERHHISSQSGWDDREGLGGPVGRLISEPFVAVYCRQWAAESRCPTGRGCVVSEVEVSAHLHELEEAEGVFVCPLLTHL